MAWRTVNALDAHGGSLKVHPAQIKPPSLPTRIGPEQTNFRRHAAATGPTPWVGRKSFQHEQLGKQVHELEQQISSRPLFRR